MHRWAHNTVLLEYWAKTNFPTHSETNLGIARQASAHWHKKPTYKFIKRIVFGRDEKLVDEKKKKKNGESTCILHPSVTLKNGEENR